MKRGNLKSSTVDIDKQIGARIRQFRLFRSMSQEGLADELGITFQQMQKYEKGVNRVSTSALILICKALDITPKEVLGPFFDGGDDSRDDSPIIQELLQEIALRDRKLKEIQTVIAAMPRSALGRIGRGNASTVEGGAAAAGIPD